MSIEITHDEKPSELLQNRANAAYQISTYPCLKLLSQISEFNKTRKTPEIKNETYVECIKLELKKLNENSALLIDFNENLEIDEKNCELISNFIVEPQKTQIENFFNSSKLQKCKIEEFLQLDKLKVKIYEEYLAPTVNLTIKEDFEKFTNEFSLNVHAMADKQIKCILREIF